MTERLGICRANEGRYFCDLWAGHEGDHAAHVGANWENIPPDTELARWPQAKNSSGPPAKTPGVKPLTIVEANIEVTEAEMAGRVVKTMAEQGDLLQAYHKVWYEAPHTWHYLHFLGIGMMKCPNDLWMYQELMTAHRPRVVIETGTYMGGSALWFAFLMDMLQIEGGRVYTIDFEDRVRAQHPRITFLGGDSRDQAIRDAIVAEIEHAAIRCEKCGNVGAETALGPDRPGDVCPVVGCDGILTVVDGLVGPILISLDADHSADHVRRELELYAPLAGVGDVLVVEDTNISWGDPHVVTVEDRGSGNMGHCSCGEIFLINTHDLGSIRCPKDDGTGDRGARGGIEDYLAKHPGEFIQDPLCERWLLTMHPGGWLRRVKECDHE